MSAKSTSRDPNETKTPENWQKSFKNKQPSQFTDPCRAASQASMECLDKNDYDRDACLEYFRAYRECKELWMQQRRADRRAGRANGL